MGQRIDREALGQVIDRGEQREWREKAGRLAAELRAAIEALDVNGPGLAALDEAVGLACELPTPWLRHSRSAW